MQAQWSPDISENEPKKSRKYFSFLGPTVLHTGSPKNTHGMHIQALLALYSDHVGPSQIEDIIYTVPAVTYSMQSMRPVHDLVHIVQETTTTRLSRHASLDHDKYSPSNIVHPIGTR